MITPAYVQAMAAYNAEMNRRLYAAAARLSDAERRAERGAFFGSIHNTLNHLLWGDRTWMSRFDGWDKPAPPLAGNWDLIGDFEALRSARAEADAGLLGWAASVGQAWLDGRLTWISGATGREVSRPVAILVAGLFNHQTHHRGQVHAMLTAAGQQTGDTDLFVILQE